MLSDAAGAYLADAEATGTITNADPLPAAWLMRFGRAAADHAVGAIDERMLEPARAELRGNFGPIAFGGGFGCADGYGTDLVGPTLKTFAAEYVERRSPRWKPSTKATVVIFLDSAILPALGHLRLGSIARADVARFFHEYGHRSRAARTAVMTYCATCAIALSPWAIGPKLPRTPVPAPHATAARRGGSCSARLCGGLRTNGRSGSLLCG
ncbi:MAG: hypothetical protein OXU81_03720 [Gammaproteobacteria bacterium]|nr:hypothetical protein [Gammaproteobacteria bacterium]